MSVRLGVVLVSVAACAFAQAEDAYTSPVSETGIENPRSAGSLYAQESDLQLTELAAQWETLDKDQRRALLTEVKMRMASNKAEEPLITIKTRRRYGRTIRRPDGSLVRIETTEQVLRYHRPTTPGDGKHAFGMGFERRAADGPSDPNETKSAEPGTDAPDLQPAPVITVSSDPS